jgi:hypothetical protein
MRLIIPMHRRVAPVGGICPPLIPLEHVGEYRMGWERTRNDQ